MGYMHIDNLNKNDDVLMFKQVWATEKVHGTSAHIAWNPENKEITYFSGGASYDSFKELFDTTFEERFMGIVEENGPDVPFAVYGEAYGGKMQGMSMTYGKKLRFIVFEARVGSSWLDFPSVQQIAGILQQDVVPGKILDCTEEALTEYRNAPSEVAVMCGCQDNTDRYGNHPPLREGIVIRPLVELRKNNGARIIAKYKNPDFSERQSKKDAEYKIRVETQEHLDAVRMAEEWVTETRLEHVLDALGIHDPKMSDLSKVIPGMVEDVLREGGDEVNDNAEFKRMVGGCVVKLFKKHIGVL